MSVIVQHPHIDSSAEQGDVIWYRPARTVVQLSGTVTTTATALGEQEVSRISDVAVGTEADTGTVYGLVFDEHVGTERQLDIKLTADQRLSGASSTTSGAGAQIIEAAVRVVSLASKVAPVLIGLTTQIDLDVEFGNECEEMAHGRNAFKSAVEKLQTELASLATRIGTDGASPVDLTRLKELQAALAVMRAELKPFEDAFDSWRAGRFPDTVQSFTYGVGTDELPSREDTPLTRSFSNSELTGELAVAARHLGTVVVRVHDTAARPPKHPDPSGGILYRFPRRLHLAVYQAVESDQKLKRNRTSDKTTTKTKAKANGPQQEYRLAKVLPVWVVDRFSYVGVIPIKSSLFRKYGATAEFGDTGTLTHIGNSETSAAGTVAKALSEVGGEIQDSLGQATKIAAAFPSAPDPALQALQDDVQRQELEARLAKANKTIADATGPGRT
jgi:hypothetical protein